MFGPYDIVDILPDNLIVRNVNMSGYMFRRSYCSDPKLYVFQEIKSSCVFCSLSFIFIFIGDKVEADHFKGASLPLFKAEDRIKFARDEASTHVR